jgi:undecaprenyl-diphosphatase
MKLLYSIHKYDLSVFTWLMNGRLLNMTTTVCRYLSKTGDGQFYPLVVILLCWSGDGFDSQLFQVALLAFAIERPVYFILKNSFKRDRPEAALTNFHSFIKPSDQFSFPSGHTSAAFMMATLVSNLMPSLVIPLYFWASLVGFSRVLLGVHFPTDTLVGASMGMAIAFFVLGQFI